MVFWGFFGVYILPKWLIKVPGHIPILFGWLLELRKFCQNLDPGTSYLLPKCFQNTRNIWNHPGQILFMSIWDSKQLENFRENVCLMYHTLFIFQFFLNKWIHSLKIMLWRWGSKNDKLSIKNICKSLNMNFISIKKHEIKIW